MLSVVGQHGLQSEGGVFVRHLACGRRDVLHKRMEIGAPVILGVGHLIRHHMKFQPAKLLTWIF